MKKRILVSCLALVLLLAGCGGSKTEKKAKPLSSPNSTDALEEMTVSGGLEITLEDLGINEDYDGYYEEDDTGDSSTYETVTKNTMKPTLQTAWNSFVYTDKPGGSDKEADAMRQKVLSTGNTSNYYKWTGKTFYVSPTGDNNNDGLSPQKAVKNLNADTFYKNKVNSGDAILFERGGEWRMTTSISTREGVIYGSYGTGEKPTFIGSPRNYAEESLWSASNLKNVWKLTIADQDIGLIVFNEGELLGHKKLKGLVTLEKTGDYYFNEKDDTVYLYCDKGNPGKVYNDIEVALKKNCFGCGKDNVTIDNIRMKYYGTFGVAMCGNDNTKITNCEIGFIGGAIQSGDVRYGNGIQQWNSTDKQLVENCWVYQCYDTAITWQGSDTYEPGVDKDGNKRIRDKVYYKDVTYRNNLCEYNILDFEYWHNSLRADSDKDFDDSDTTANIINFNLVGNICRFTGYGWSAGQRPDFVGWALKPGKTNFKNASGCVITDNILDSTARHLVYWNFSGQDDQPGFDIYGNTYYQRSNKRDEVMWFGSARNATSQQGLENAVMMFDSNPKLIKWLN